MEVRDAVREGTTTIIIGTGGVEQNGPYVAGGKHNYVLQTVLPPIAEAIGDAHITPIVKFVPRVTSNRRPRATCSTPERSALRQRHLKLCSRILLAATKVTDSST